MKFAAVAAASTLLFGCATAQLRGEPPFCPPDPGETMLVVIEPFFETAGWQTSVKTEIATLTPGLPGVGLSVSPFSHDVAIQHLVAVQPLYAKAAALAEEHRQVVAEVHRLRPSWRVSSTGMLAELGGPAKLVRVVVEGSELVESNRTLKNLAFIFGLVILPLQFINLTPVEEADRVYGRVQRYDAAADVLRSRLVRYASQPDFAVNTSGLSAIEHRFGLDIAYTEGLLANETPREGVLLKGFSERLAAAIVALVEES